MSDGWIEWTELAATAAQLGIEVGEFPRSELLLRIADDLLDRFYPSSGLAWCQHFGGLTLEDRPHMVIFVAQACAVCPACAPDLRAEIERDRKRVCIGCDLEKASALHRATFAPDPDLAPLTLAVQLCGACAQREGLLGTALDVIP